MCIDANDLYIGESDGKTVRFLLHDTSNVPRKHGKGGQSEQRFKRARKQALIHWFKESYEKIESIRKDRGVFLGASSVYISYINRYMNMYIIERKSISIDDNCLWELIGKSRYE